MVIRIYRNTNVETIPNTFYPGSAVRARDLNDNFTSTLYVLQEADKYSQDANENANEAVAIAEAADAKADQAIETADAADAKADQAITDAAGAQEAAVEAAADAAQAAIDAAASGQAAESAHR